MKRICILLVMAGLAALGARAQTVTGTGSTNTIPKFTGSSTIGDSVMLESNGNIGIGPGAINPFIDGKLTVLDTRDVNDVGQGPSSIFGVAQCKVNNFCAAVRGDVHSGFAHGVIGVQFVEDGQSGGGGVQGISFGTSGFNSGVFGHAEGTTGFGAGVLGITSSPQGTGGIFKNLAGGNVLVGINGVGGQDVSVFRVDGNGTVHANGGFRPFGADFAESVAVKGGTENYTPGDLLVIDASGERRLSLSQTPYSTLVAGIYSTRPGVVASTHRLDEALPKNEVPLAVVGIVPCKVTAENGPVVAGDILVTSSTPGYAMRGTDRGRMLGAVVGKALEPLQKGTGVIQVLVTLQ
jgi:hypothetical protein